MIAKKVPERNMVYHIWSLLRPSRWTSEPGFSICVTCAVIEFCSLTTFSRTRDELCHWPTNWYQILCVGKRKFWSVGVDGGKPLIPCIYLSLSTRLTSKKYVWCIFTVLQDRVNDRVKRRFQDAISLSIFSIAMHLVAEQNKEMHPIERGVMMTERRKVGKRKKENLVSQTEYRVF